MAQFATFNYDKQTRRFLEQFIRIFSGYHVEFGKDPNGNSILHRVPVHYAITNKQVAAILNQNSENFLQSVPMMVAYIADFKYDRERVQDPTFVDKMHIRTRGTDPATGELTHYQGGTFTIERLMPVPYKLELALEVWTSNIEQKLQLIEQLAVNFNPSMEIQSTDNYVDWTSLSTVTLVDNSFSSRTISTSQNTDEIDVMTYKFELPVWLTAPAKVKKLGVITDVVMSVYGGYGDLEKVIESQSELLGKRMHFTPMGYNLIVENNNTLRLSPRQGPTSGKGTFGSPANLTPNPPWRPVIETMGNMIEGVSSIVLTDERTERIVAGTIAYHPMDNTALIFTPDPETVPQNTIKAVNAVIDPQKVGPGAGLPAATRGQRYLLVNNLGNIKTAPQNAPHAWNSQTRIIAKANDIIEFDGQSWRVQFDSGNHDAIEFVTNTNTNVQYRWNGTQWLKAWTGLYEEGFWSIVI